MTRGILRGLQILNNCVAYFLSGWMDLLYLRAPTQEMENGPYGNFSSYIRLDKKEAAR